MIASLGVGQSAQVHHPRSQRHDGTSLQPRRSTSSPRGPGQDARLVDLIAHHARTMQSTRLSWHKFFDSAQASTNGSQSACDIKGLRDVGGCAAEEDGGQRGLIT